MNFLYYDYRFTVARWLSIIKKTPQKSGVLIFATYYSDC